MGAREVLYLCFIFWKKIGGFLLHLGIFVSQLPTRIDSHATGKERDWRESHPPAHIAKKDRCSFIPQFLSCHVVRDVVIVLCDGLHGVSG